MATANTRRNDDAREDDLYTTPPWAIHAILKREPMHGINCDAGYGTGNITNELVKHGYDRLFIQTIDKYRHGPGLDVLADFITFKPEHNYDNVITNPPFKLLSPFIRKCIEVSNGKVLVFARINALEGGARYKDIYSKYKPARIYEFVNRVKCSKGAEETEGASAVMYCWIVWDKSVLSTKPTEFHWIEDHPKDYL